MRVLKNTIVNMINFLILRVSISPDKKYMKMVWQNIIQIHLSIKKNAENLSILRKQSLLGSNP